MGNSVVPGPKQRLQSCMAVCVLGAKQKVEKVATKMDLHQKNNMEAVLSNERSELLLGTAGTKRTN